MNCFDDQAKMTDALNSQKFITGNYNHYAGECATKERKDKLMEILSEEHDMQFEVFSEMQKRGWYEPKPAPQQKVCEACEQFEQKDVTVAGRIIAKSKYAALCPSEEQSSDGHFCV